MERSGNLTQCFDVNLSGDRLGSEWQKWLRSLNLQLIARDIQDDKRKVAMLLASGGPALQEIYYSLSGEQVEECFDDVQKRLNEHFIDETIDTFERHLYRQVKQKADETFDRFVMRIRIQAEKCGFGIRMSEFIRDQVVEGCLHDKVRESIFKEKSCTLEDATNIGRLHENMLAKMKEFGKSGTKVIEKEDLNWVNKASGQSERGKRPATGMGERCYRCNQIGHRANSEKCPAKKATCRKCLKMGHFEAVCRSNNSGSGGFKRFKANPGGYQVSSGIRL